MYKKFFFMARVRAIYSRVGIKARARQEDLRKGKFLEGEGRATQNDNNNNGKNRSIVFLG